ncbi:MAG: hypothetical protein ACK4UN_16755, partial [Limisphaerales bacterium]
GEIALANQFYAEASRAHPENITPKLKRMLLSFGRCGEHLRKVAKILNRLKVLITSATPHFCR